MLDEKVSGMPSGFHVEWANPDVVIRELMLHPDEHGVYGGFYRAEDWVKFTTFFPRNFNQEEIERVIQQAFENPIQEDNYSLVGQASNGMKIRVILQKRKKEIWIYSAYPLYRGIEDPRVHVKSLGKDRIVYRNQKGD